MGLVFGLTLAGTGCSLLLSTDDLHGDDVVDAGGAEASVDAEPGTDATVEGGPDAAGPPCPNGGGLSPGSVWPMAGGCPTHHGRSALVGPQVAGDRAVYTAATNAYAGVVFAADGTIYYGTEALQGLLALTPNGTLAWAGDNGGNVSAMSAVAADGTIYSGAGFGFSALRNDGTRIFRLPADEEADGAIVIAPDGTIYFASQDNKLRAVTPQGTVKWTYPLPGNPRFSNPALAEDGTIYVGALDNGLHAVTPDGVKKWRFETGGAAWSPTIAPDGTIYVGAENSTLYAVNPSGVLKWAFPTGSAVGSMPALMGDGTIVVGTSGGELFAVRPDGTKRWSYTVGSSMVECDPVIGADGTVYVGSQEGVLHAIKPDGQKLFTQNLPGRTYRQPAIGPDRRLYVSIVRKVDGKGELRSIGP